jgi:hypothetical protein
MNTPQAKVWLCWSPRQNCFHVETEPEGVAKNRNAFLRDVEVDFVPIGIFASEHEANATARKLRPALLQREKRENSLD